MAYDRVLARSFRVIPPSDMTVFCEASRYTAIFYDALVVSGALLVGLSGFFLIIELGLGLFTEPWIVGMWGLFLFEFIEGNAVTRIQFRKTLRRSRKALARGGPLTDDVREQSRSLLNQITHFLDIPLFTVIVYCGTVRTDTWTHVLIAIAMGLLAATILTVLVPRLARESRINPVP